MPTYYKTREAKILPTAGTFIKISVQKLNKYMIELERD